MTVKPFFLQLPTPQVIYWLCTDGPNFYTQKNYMQAYFRTDKHRLYCGIFYRIHIQWNTKEK